MPLKAVLDTNIYFGALLGPGSAPARTVRAWQAGRFRVVASPALLAELRSVLRGIPAGGRVPPHEERARFIQDVEAGSVMVDPEPALAIPGISPGDNRVLEAAVTAAAGFIVTNDRAFLALGEYEGIPIVTPSRFLRALRVTPGGEALPEALESPAPACLGNCYPASTPGNGWVVDRSVPRARMQVSMGGSEVRGLPLWVGHRRALGPLV